MKKLAEFYKALADENRLKILQMLRDKEMCVCEIIDQLDMSQPAISHHLKILRQAGLVKDSKEGKWIYYSLDREVIIEFNTQFQTMINVTITENQEVKVNRTDCSVCEQLEKKQKKQKKQKKPLKEVK